MVTGAEWDHIGVVIPAALPPKKAKLGRSLAKKLTEPSLEGMRILESSGAGVTCYALVDRLRAYEYYKVLHADC